MGGKRVPFAGKATIPAANAPARRPAARSFTLALPGGRATLRDLCNLVVPLSPTTSNPDRPTFRQAYCARFGCAEQDFESQLLRRCLPLTSRPLAWLLRLCLPRFFEAELEVVANLGLARSLAEIDFAANELASVPESRTGLLRGVLRQRLSGRRLMAVAAAVWPEESRRPAPAAATAAAPAPKFVAPLPKHPGSQPASAREGAPSPATSAEQPASVATQHGRGRGPDPRHSPYTGTGLRRR